MRVFLIIFICVISPILFAQSETLQLGEDTITLGMGEDSLRLQKVAHNNFKKDTLFESASVISKQVYSNAGNIVTYFVSKSDTIYTSCDSSLFTGVIQSGARVDDSLAINYSIRFLTCSEGIPIHLIEKNYKKQFHDSDTTSGLKKSYLSQTIYDWNKEIYLFNKLQDTIMIGHWISKYGKSCYEVMNYNGDGTVLSYELNI